MVRVMLRYQASYPMQATPTDSLGSMAIPKSLLLACPLVLPSPVCLKGWRHVPRSQKGSPGAGVGIPITDGTVVHEISWGFLTVAASSTALEWLEKLMAVYLCRHTRATILLICDM